MAMGAAPSTEAEADAAIYLIGGPLANPKAQATVRRSKRARIEEIVPSHEPDADSPHLYKRQDRTPKISQSGKVVVIRIPGGHEYQVHAHLLVQFSDYFLKALNSGFLESSSMTFELEEHATPATMGALVDWVYEKVQRSSDKELDVMDCLLDLKDDWVPIAYKLWLLADYLQIPALQNDVMGKLYCAAERRRTREYSSVWASLPPTGTALFRFHCTMIAAKMARGTDHAATRRRLLRLDKKVVAEVATIVLTHKDDIFENVPVEDFFVQGL